jgi:xanthine dehydrogenase iron-sulfur cluster and FAD-binding subunit A
MSGTDEAAQAAYAQRTPSMLEQLAAKAGQESIFNQEEGGAGGNTVMSGDIGDTAPAAAAEGGAAPNGSTSGGRPTNIIVLGMAGSGKTTLMTVRPRPLP